MTSSTEPVRTIVGIFRDDRKAAEAMRSLDAAGFNADRVQLVADNASRASEIGGTSHALAGGLAGLLAGALVVAGFTVWGGLAADLIGLIIGSVGVVGGFAAIGFVVGRTLGRHSPDSHLFAAAVRHGGAVVAVQCAEEERGLASQVLDGTGAREVRDEAGPGAL